MNAIETLTEEFAAVMRDFNASNAIRLLSGGRLSVSQYKGILREIYFYTREDPQLQALATVYFRGPDRKFVKMFLKHAISEIGHEQLALNDLRALGDDVSLVPTSNPLPATMGLTGFAFYQIEHVRPVGYLGYLYFLEFMPTHYGAEYGAALVRSGVPAAALTFLHEHVAVDVSHNKMMEKYIVELVHDEADLDAVVYAMKATAHLYSNMLWAAIQEGEVAS